jgi:hypothetical protein
VRELRILSIELEVVVRRRDVPAVPQHACSRSVPLQSTYRTPERWAGSCTHVD